MFLLLDQENVAHHGLNGIEALNENDFIVTFLGKKSILPEKVSKLFKETIAKTEIQSVLVGTKNAADYQLVTYLTSAIIDKKDDVFLVLTKDAGFDISIDYLREKYPTVKIKRCQCILEYLIEDYFERDFNLSERDSKKVFDILWNTRYSPSHVVLKSFVSNSFNKLALYLKNSIPLFQEYLRNLKISDSSDKEYLNSFSKVILQARTPQDTYKSMGDILHIDVVKYERYLKTIRRCLYRSSSYTDFNHRIVSNKELLDLGENIKRIDIPKKLKPFYSSYKKSISKKG